MIDKDDILYNDFNVKTHKKYFIDYLEVVIDRSGKIIYAVPSHNGILEKMICDKHKIFYDEWDFSIKAAALCPREKMCDYREWLCEESECVMIWGIPNSMIIGTPNDKQKESIEMLKKENLF